MNKETVHTTTIRIPRSLWVAARRLEERKVTASFKDAVCQGLELLIEKYEKELKQ